MWKSGLRRHMIHMKIKWHQTSINVRVYSVYDMNNNKHADKVRRFVCNICKNTFSRIKLGLRDHIVKFLNKNPNMENTKRIFTENPVSKRSKTRTMREAIREVLL